MGFLDGVQLVKKYPAILPKQHCVSDLIMRHYHLACGHSGVNALSMVRQKYWLIQDSVSLRRALGSCFECRRRQTTVGQQKMANLPEDRVSPSELPFTIVGVDYFGPLEVKRDRSMVKRYGVPFTYLTLRAINLEVVHSLDTDSFML